MPPATTLLNQSTKIHKNKSGKTKSKEPGNIIYKSKCVIVKTEGITHTHLLKC